MGRIHRVLWSRAVEHLLDDELDRTGAQRTLDHLDRCRDCLRDLERLARVQRSLARVATPARSSAR